MAILTDNRIHPVLPLITNPIKRSEGDFEDIALDSFTSPSLSSPSTNRSSTSTTSSASYSDTSYTNSSSESIYEQDIDLVTHKLNGYAIQSLKSQSAISLNSPTGSPTFNHVAYGGFGSSIVPTLSTVSTTASTITGGSTPKPIDVSTKYSSTLKNSPSYRRASAGNVSRHRDTTVTPSSNVQNGFLKKSLSMSGLSTTRTRTRSTFSFETSSVVSISRRNSAASNRRKLTVEQLELQYDSQDADDDDLPDDTIVWNVPLSAALYTKSRNGSTSSNSLHTSSSSSSFPIHNNNSGLPSPSLSGKSDLMAIKESEPTVYFSFNGMENLSEDARDLTHAFQKSALTVKAEQDIASRDYKAKMAVPSDIINTSSPSVDHKAVASYTRPAYLPPKDSSEERKHLRQYLDLMEKSAAADKTRIEKAKNDRTMREKQRLRDEREWTERVIPNFNRAIQEPRTRELWWRGIPPKLRSKIWKERIGNKLQVSENTYYVALTKAKQAQAQHQRRDNKHIALLLKDSNNTFEDLRIFGRDGPLHEDLVNVLLACTFYRTDIGYRRGMNNMAALLLLNMSAVDSFIALVNLLSTPMCSALLTRDDRLLTSYYTSFLKVLNTKLPSLYGHFKSIRLPPSAYLEPMLSPLFCKHTSVDIASRIWDIMIFEGETFLLRAALGVMTVLEHRLYGNHNEVLSELGWSSGKMQLGDDDSFIKVVRNALKSTNV